METAERFSGSMTLVFTDIEGSTALLREVGERAYVERLAEHRRVLRAAFAERGGVEVDTQGDAFFYVFDDPVSAVASAVAGQAGLASGPVRVRIGIHTGEVVATDEGYAGAEVHRAARIAAAGHGGQTVVSATTRRLLPGGFSESVGFTDLGEHRLKDFDDPIALFQVGADQFPPLRTISNTNLPSPPSSFVGRERERDDVLSLLRDGARAVTLTGPGGTGKTRLSIEVAAELVPEYAAGVFWVPLAALRDPALVLEAVARVLGVDPGVDDLADHIGDRRLLLVLDNLEQVIDAADDLAALLSRCLHLSLVVSSREAMRIPGEVEYAVPPLSDRDAVELFCQRARLLPDATLVELCRRLDNLPLALEMAAARTTILTPQQILDRLGQRLDLLKAGRGLDARQQTMRTTIAWSHDLLTPEEQILFAHLAVFRGGATLDAAEQVADADLDTLQSLVDKSLLRNADGRFTMLEMIRAFAWERLEARGELSDLRRRHAEHVLRDTERGAALVETEVDKTAILRRLDEEHDNVRASLEWARDAHADDVLLRLVAACYSYWNHRGYEQDKELWYPVALERATTPPKAHMRVLLAASSFAAELGDYARSDALIAEWRDVAEATGDEYEVLRAMNSAALNASDQGRFEEAETQLLALKDRAERGGHEELVAFATINLSVVALDGGDHSAALIHSDEAADRFRALGDEFGLSGALGNLGWAALALGDPARGAGAFAESVTCLTRLGALKEVCAHLHGLACALTALAEPERGARLMGGAERLTEEVGGSRPDGISGDLCDRALAALQAALGEERLEAEWATGRALPLDELEGLARRAASDA